MTFFFFLSFAQNVSLFGLASFLAGLKNSLEKWIEPTRLRGPIQWDNLKAHEIIISGNFHIPLPLEIQNLQSKGNLYVGTLNGINMEEFLKNSIKLDENLSLTNITFGEEVFQNVSYKL